MRFVALRRVADDRDTPRQLTGRFGSLFLLAGEADWYQPHNPLAVEEGQSAGNQFRDSGEALPGAKL